MLALMDNLQNVLTNTSPDLLAAGGAKALDCEALLTLRSKCMGFLQQAFRALCRAAAAREFDPSELHGGKVRKAVQVGRAQL